MKNILFFLITFLLCSCTFVQTIDAIESEDIFLKVAVNDAEFKSDTSNCSGSSCSIFWWEYEATVLEVVRGDFTEKTVFFTAAHSAPRRKETLQEWYVLLNPKLNKLNSNIEYQLVNEAFTGEKNKIMNLKNGT